MKKLLSVPCSPTAERRSRTVCSRDIVLWSAAPWAVALVLSACGGGSAGRAASVVPDSSVALQASSPGALLAYAQQKLNQQVDQGRAISGGNYSYWGGGVSVAADLNMNVGSLSSPSFSSTTLQEGGVDEADLLKTDGSRIFSMRANTSDPWRMGLLRVDKRQSDGSLQADGSLALGGTDRLTGMHVAPGGELVAVIGQTEQWLTIGVVPMLADTGNVAPTQWAPPQAVIEVVAAKSGQALGTTHSVRIDGQLIASRMVGNTLYVVTSWYPSLHTLAQTGSASVADQKAAIAQLGTADLLPTVRIQTPGAASTPAAEPLLADTDCYVQAANASDTLQMTTITAFNLASPSLERSSRCFMGGTEAVYMSGKNVYLATSRFGALNKVGIMEYNGQVNTDIHKFATNGMRIDYRGSGEVGGHLGWDAGKTSYRMSEYQDDLRVLSYTDQFGWFGEIDASNSSSKPSPAVLTLLREDGSGTKLKTVSTLPNAQRPAPIGLSGEQVYAVRFLGDRGYVVTFRRTDPLYVLDLSNPADPKVTGELKTNGYSDYLFPLANNLLLGVGRNADDQGRVQGVKVSLFDVGNVSNPTELVASIVGKAGSGSGLDYGSHGINLRASGTTSRIALPVGVAETPDPQGSAWYRPSYQGLARFEVDTVNKTLIEKPALIGQTFASDAGWDYTNVLANERSVQIDQNVYYLNGQGKLQGAGW